MRPAECGYGCLHSSSYLLWEEAHVLTIDIDGYRVGIVSIARIGHEDSYQR
jgi:hypothetical protein